MARPLRMRELQRLTQGRLTDSPNRDSGKCNDLAFSNCPASSRVERTLNTGSDHYTVVTSLPEPIRSTPRAGKKYLPFDRWEDFGQLMHSFAWTLPTGRQKQKHLRSHRESHIPPGQASQEKDYGRGRPRPLRRGTHP